MDHGSYGRTEPVQRSCPELTGYGCGPANPEDLHTESYLSEDDRRLVATVEPDAVLTSGAPNVMYGGHIASLVDCHSTRTAITFACRAEDRPLGADPRIASVAGDPCVDYRRPTPIDRPVRLTARVGGDVGRRTTVACELGDDGEPTATGEAVAVTVSHAAVAGHHQA